MLHFGSDEGVEMAATYHSIISTVKLQGRSAWKYLGKFFTKIFNGCRDFIGLRPGKHSIASEAFCMNEVSFALQNIKIRLWQAVKISKGYWNFITRSPRQVVFR